MEELSVCLKRLDGDPGEVAGEAAAQTTPTCTPELGRRTCSEKLNYLDATSIQSQPKQCQHLLGKVSRAPENLLFQHDPICVLVYRSYRVATKFNVTANRFCLSMSHCSVKSHLNINVTIIQSRAVGVIAVVSQNWMSSYRGQFTCDFQHIQFHLEQIQPIKIICRDLRPLCTSGNPDN